MSIPMTETLGLLLAVPAGVAFGVVFFGGLWWTVRKGMASPNPALWFMVSLILRMGITLSGFYLVSGGQWLRLLVCVLGFIVGRLAVELLTSRIGQDPRRVAVEPSHAP
jgi:F1F0 ATPase subunit 2